jgi:nanoRNase/pAp phosphatase (c-di-AMP/oligoRNAs hydrolase)
MPKTYNFAPVKQALQTAKTVLILLPQDPSFDSVAAALSLYLSLAKVNLSVSVDRKL